MPAYDIWIGRYTVDKNLPKTMEPTEPELLGRVVAQSFAVACWKYDLMSTLQGIEDQENAGIDLQYKEYFGKSYFDPKTNSNSLTGPYFRTAEEAFKTFENVRVSKKDKKGK